MAIDIESKQQTELITEKIKNVTPEQRRDILEYFFNSLCGVTFADLEGQEASKLMAEAIKNVLLNVDDTSPASISMVDQVAPDKIQDGEIIEVETDETVPPQQAENQMDVFGVAEEDINNTETEQTQIPLNTNEELNKKLQEELEKETDNSLTPSPETTSDSETDDSDIKQPSSNSTTNITNINTTNINITETKTDTVAEEIPIQPDQTIQLRLNKTDRTYHLFDHTLEDEMNALCSLATSRAELDKFFNVEKQLFKTINGEISIFGVYIMMYLMSLVTEEEALNNKYVIKVDIDKNRNSAKMTSMWDALTHQVSFEQNKETKVIYFKTEEDAALVLNHINNASKQSYIELEKTKENDYQNQEEIPMPVNTKNILNFPLFCFQTQEHILDSFIILDELLNSRIQEGQYKNKTFIKLIKYDEWGKQKWLKYFEKIISYSQKLLTPNELSSFDFDTPENLYKKLCENKNIKDIKLFIITDLAIIPSLFVKNKGNPEQKEYYELIYYSWVKFMLIGMSSEILLEQYDYNLYSFICRTKHYPIRALDLFRPKLFLNIQPLVDLVRDIKEGNELKILKTDLKIGFENPAYFEVAQLNLLFNKHSINWLDYYFIMDTIISLIDNGFIEMVDSRIYINKNMKLYFDMFKKENFKMFYDNVTMSFDSYFAKDAKSFIEKIKIINQKPF